MASSGYVTVVSVGREVTLAQAGTETKYVFVKLSTATSLLHFSSTVIRAVIGQPSSAKSHLANKIQNASDEESKINSNSLEFEDVLYFDLQPHQGSVVMEWKQTLFEI